MSPGESLREPRGRVAPDKRSKPFKTSKNAKILVPNVGIAESTTVDNAVKFKVSMEKVAFLIKPIFGIITQYHS